MFTSMSVVFGALLGLLGLVMLLTFIIHQSVYCAGPIERPGYNGGLDWGGIAIDLETGETIWQDVLPAGGQANPMVYSVDGREYLVIMAGGHHFMETPKGDYVIAYALPRAHEAPAQ